MQEQDEEAVIGEVLSGSQAAFTSLVVRYQRYVFTLAMRYVNNREIAEELAQDVFIKAYRYLGDFKGKSKFSTWLYTIVHSTCLSYLRTKKPYMVSEGEARLEFFAGQQSPSETPGYLLEQKTEQALLEQAMDKLEAEERQIISLYYQGGLTVEETGQVTGLSAGNVKIKLFRARKKLRELLRPFEKEII